MLQTLPELATLWTRQYPEGQQASYPSVVPRREHDERTTVGAWWKRNKTWEQALSSGGQALLSPHDGVG